MSTTQSLTAIYEGNPSMLSSLKGNKEFLELVTSTKMRDYAKILVTEGSDALYDKLIDDSDALELLDRLKSVLTDHAEL